MNETKKIIFAGFVVILLGYMFGCECGRILQDFKISVSGNSSVCRTEYIDKSTINQQNTDIGETADRIGKTNQSIKETTADIEQLLQQQYELLRKCERNIKTAVPINEEGK